MTMNIAQSNEMLSFLISILRVQKHRCISRCEKLTGVH
jgi:hypothetical protein